MNFTIPRARHSHRLLYWRLLQQHRKQNAIHIFHIHGKEKCSGISENWRPSYLTLESVNTCNGLPATYKCVYLWYKHKSTNFRVQKASVHPETRSDRHEIPGLVLNPIPFTTEDLRISCGDYMVYSLLVYCNVQHVMCLPTFRSNLALEAAGFLEILVITKHLPVS